MSPKQLSADGESLTNTPYREAGLSSARLHHLLTHTGLETFSKPGGPPTQIRDRTAVITVQRPHQHLFTCCQAQQQILSFGQRPGDSSHPSHLLFRHTGRTRSRSPPTASPLFRVPAVRNCRWESTRAQQFHVALSRLADVFERRALQLAANAPAPLFLRHAWPWAEPAVVCRGLPLVCLELTDFSPPDFRCRRLLLRLVSVISDAAPTCQRANVPTN